MNTTVLTKPSPISAKYWSELKDLSDNVKLELITLLSGSMAYSEEQLPSLAKVGQAVLRVYGKTAVRQNKSLKISVQPELQTLLM